MSQNEPQLSPEAKAIIETAISAGTAPLTPSKALAAVMEDRGLDAAVVPLYGQWVKITLVARFGEGTAMVAHASAVQEAPQPVDNPSRPLLLLIARDMGKDPAHLLSKMTFEEQNTLDAFLKTPVKEFTEQLALHWRDAVKDFELDPSAGEAERHALGTLRNVLARGGIYA